MRVRSVSCARRGLRSTCGARSSRPMRAPGRSPRLRPRCCAGSLSSIFASTSTCTEVALPIHRRSALKVRDGRVLKKNNWRLNPGDYRTLAQSEIRLHRRRPPDGSRHLITIAELRRFLALLPDWDEVAVGLDAIVLDSASDCAGWCGPGVVAICAWPHDLWDWWPAELIDEHRHILDLLGVERVPIDASREHREWTEELAALGVTAPARGGDLELRWTESQARAYQLLHILPHELGHHHDRITTRKRRYSGRGETYAEAYANRVLEQVWPAYSRTVRI